jgi:hypothetical protein
MKRILLILTMVSISVSAQMSEKLKVDNQKKSSQKQKSLKPSNTHLSKSVSFWSDDFSDPSTWVVDHDATACNLDWEIGVGLTGCPQMEDFMSTTANNGFAMVDSDEYGGEEGGTEVEDSWFTTANPIDLSNASSAKIQFESYYEKFNSEQCFLVISTTNDDWPELTPNYDPSSNPNVFDLFTNQESLTQGSTAQGSNPGTYEVNISSVAANQPEVWIRFHWTGTYGYSWFVDDVSIVEMQPNDISLNYGYLSNVSSIEYGRIPVSQVNDTLILGGEVLNAGSNNQMDITIQASISNSSGNEILSITASQESLESDSLAYVENSSTGFAPLAVGTYTLDVTASSAMDNSAGEYFNDNTYSRNFEITENLYSIDGFDVYENANANMSGIGTTSWESDQDGLIIMNMYEIVEETTTSGLVAEIATNTQVYSAGAEIVPFLLSLDAWNEDDVYNRLVEGDFISVNSWNMEEGKIWLPFDETVLNPGTYLACVELYSGNGANHVAILDDQTVAQPWFASSIYMPSDQTSYSNGIACAIRLGVDNYVAIEENGTDNKVSVSPNPSTGVFTVSSNSSDIKTIEVVNILGELIDSRIIDGVLNETFDMTLFSAGMYFVKSSNGTSVSTQRVIIK